MCPVFLPVAEEGVISMFKSPLQHDRTMSFLHLCTNIFLVCLIFFLKFKLKNVSFAIEMVPGEDNWK